MAADQRAERLRRIMQYDTAFRAVLEAAVQNALPYDPLPAVKLHALYSPKEIVAAMSAAYEAELEPPEGVAAFVFVSAAAQAHSKKPFLSRFFARQASNPYADDHLAIFHYAKESLLQGKDFDETKTRLFADLYAAELDRAE